MNDPSEQTRLTSEHGPVPSLPTGVDQRTTADHMGQPTEQVPLSVIPNYQVLEEIGRGAMGVVYRARQVPLQRDVALKMILVGVHASDHDRQRFLNEAQTIAGL